MPTIYAALISLPHDLTTLSLNLSHKVTIQTTIDRYGYLLKGGDTEQAMKLENALNYTEHPGDSSGSARRS
ncbi:MAG: hypothetical protein K8F52_06915 [Candidatus Scalindua rubra]|nr:hypothetical protein [Candidatus Scalindua rubra]